KVNIIANLYNNENILPAWIREVERVIHILGPSKVCISIVENYSVDGTKDILHYWNSSLKSRGICSKVTIGYKESTTDRDKMQRIDRLSELRNVAFDQIINKNVTTIFLNDIIFVAEDMLTLLLDLYYSDIDVSCAMDYNGVGLYDVWVTRSIQKKVVSPIYPYFTDHESVKNLTNGFPVDVYSC
ncbi:hypothetical protein DL89DRAFT_212228, partial [Linderina pennispora]